MNTNEDQIHVQTGTNKPMETDEICMKMSSVQQINAPSAEIIANKIQQLYSMIVSQGGKLNNEQLKKINLSLDNNLKVLYEKESNAAISLNENRESSNKNVKKQLRFFSIKELRLKIPEEQRLNKLTLICILKDIICLLLSAKADILYIMLRTFKLKIVDPNNKLSDRTIGRLPLFFVDLEPQANHEDIYDIKNLCYHITKVEPPRKYKEVPQYKICQIFTLKTTVSKHQTVQKIQQKPAKPVTQEVSFAQMASSSNENQKGPMTQTRTQQKKNVPSLSDVMAVITKLNERLDRLENV
ncbi:hypothetical protein QTP88_022328 [Uroleucon formosanum]